MEHPGIGTNAFIILFQTMALKVTKLNLSSCIKTKALNIYNILYSKKYFNIDSLW